MASPMSTLASSERPSRVGVVVAVCAIALALALGTILRLADPLSSPVVPAEDPYTHMALVREHLRTGELDPLNEKDTLYPPGLHGFLAAAVVLTGADLYDLTRFGPVVLGAIGILGLAALLWKTAGPVAGFVGALALAVAPEAIARSTMMSPTALDLALLPAFLYALLRILAGRVGWAGVAASIAFFLALAHPWLLAILCAAGLVFLLSVVTLPWPSSRAEPVSLLGATVCVAVLGAGLGIALTMPTFGFVLPVPDGVDLSTIGLGVAALAFVPALVLFLGRRRGWPQATVAVRPASPWIRLALSLALAASLAVAWVLATRQGMPDLVDLPRMVGWPILALAAIAIVALPFIASPVANLAASLTAVTLPFVLFNPLHSEFLPHRTVIFLVLGLALLAGIAAGAAVRTIAALLQPSHHPASGPGVPAQPSRARSAARPFLLAMVPAILVAALGAGAVYAGTPDAYDGGWYRLYNACDIEALRDIAALANDNPTALVVTGDWQAKLVLAALTEDASRVGYIGEVFSSQQRRDDLVAQMQKEGRPLILVTDRHLRAETPDADLAFLASPPWQPAGAWCANMGVPQPRVTAFTVGALA